MERKLISSKVKLVVLLLLIIATITLIILLINFFSSVVFPNVTEVFINNDFQTEVAESIDRFYENEDLADIISGVHTDENVLAVTFAGMTDPDIMYSVIDIVKRYGIKCAFFLEGAEVAEYSKIVTDIKESGNEVGSFTLYGDKYINENLAYDMIEDFVYSSILISRAANSRPDYLMCNNSRYTDDLLKAAKASGFKYTVEASHILNYQSFSTYEMAYNYIKRLPKGSVLTIKMKGVLDENEYTAPVKTQDVGKDAGINKNNPALSLSEKERLLNVIEWVCRAVNKTKRGTISLEDLPALPPVISESVITDNTAQDETAPPVKTPKNVTQKKPAVKSASDEKVRLAQLIKESHRSIVEKLRGENAGKLSVPLKLETASDRAFNYVFYGISDEAALNSVLSRLVDLQIKGVFFVSEEDIEKYPERINRITQENHYIGIALLEKNSGDFYDAAVSLLSAYNTLIRNFDVYTNIVMMPFGKTTDEISEAISSVRMRKIDFDLAVVRSADKYETSADAVIHNVFGDSMISLKYGSTVYFRLDYYKSRDNLAGELLDKIGGYDAELINLANLREKNGSQLAAPIKFIYTTERALAYVFYGIENQTALYHVLSRLDDIGCKGTFFVTENDIITYPECISDIISHGHEIGAALLPRSDTDFFSYGSALLNARKLLSERYNINMSLVMMPYGFADNIIAETASTLGMTLIEPSYSVVRNADRLETSAYNVMQSQFGESPYMLKRGDIIYFRLDFYENSDTLASELVQAIKEKLVDPVRYIHDEYGESSYIIKNVGSLLNDNKSLLYHYPVPDEAIPEAIVKAIYPGHLDGMSDDDIFNQIKKRYIGNPNITSNIQLPGFSDSQIIELDKSGTINTNNTNTVFLTFDDWGTDLETNHLLYVLKKHGVKASFFIRTNYVGSNPNLLRAIAADGHDIGSHTMNHISLSHYNPENRTYETLTEQEIETLKWELVESYNMLASVAGDIKNEKGKPVVQRFFRAPTLAQSYTGIKAVLDCGYLYTISGDFSTGDYEAESVSEVFDTLVNGLYFPSTDNKKTIVNGSIVVMHISPSAKFTAEALDLFLTENAKKSPDKRFNFARLSDFLN